MGSGTTAMKGLLRNLSERGSRQPVRKSAGRARPVRPRVEFLESRLVLSTIIVPNPGNLPGYLPDGISFDAATGVLGIKGGSNDDKAAVSIVGNQVKATLDYPQYLPGPKGLPGTTLMLHSEGSYDSSLVKQIVFYGL